MQATTSVLPAHQTLGSGPALIVLHGLLGSRTNWRSVARRLEDCRTVHLLDARNHGASPHDDRMDYARLAADVQRFMDHQRIDSADVIGHSMGGKTAMHLALETPHRVRKLVVVDIAPDVSRSDHVPLIESLMALPVARYSSRSEADAALAASVPEPELRAFLLQNLVPGSQGMRWRINLGAIKASMRELLAFEPPSEDAFTGQTLFVRGANSDYVTAAHEPRIRALFPDARIHEIARAGHWVHAEQPLAFVSVAREFLGCRAH